MQKEKKQRVFAYFPQIFMFASLRSKRAHVFRSNLMLVGAA
jgi:hypothetical protein